MNEERIQEVERLKELVVEAATYNNWATDEEYKLLRSKMIKTNEIKNLIPAFIKDCRTLDEISNHFKVTLPEGYKVRRAHIKEAFIKVLEYLESEEDDPLDGINGDRLKGDNIQDFEYSKNDLFLATLKEYLSAEGADDILKYLEPSKLTLTYYDKFTGKQWNQRSGYVEVKVPVSSKKALEDKSLFSRLSNYCSHLYETTDEYGYAGLKIGVLVGTTTINTENRDIQFYSKNQVYENLRTKVHNNNLDHLEEMYLLEACACATNGQRLSAVTMLGCAGEQLLLLLSKAYLQFLQNNGSENEIKRFKENVVEAKKAHARLDGFKRTVANQEKLFEALGLENSNLHFQYLDFLRQIRNESGHPTGIRVSVEDMNSLFINYQLLIDRVHPLILKLPDATPV